MPLAGSRPAEIWPHFLFLSRFLAHLLCIQCIPIQAWETLLAQASGWPMSHVLHSHTLSLSAA